MGTRQPGPTPGSAERATTPASAPWWFEAITIGGVLTVAAVGVVGLLAAVTGSYTTWTAMLVGVPVAGTVGWTWLHGRPSTHPVPGATTGAVLALALAVGFAAFAGSVPSQNVLVSRDPGSYQNTARWLSADGSLQPDARGEAFADIDDLRFSSNAAYSTATEDGQERGDLEFQFNHMTSVVLAAGFDLGGYRVLFRLPALVAALGLLAVYAVAARVTRRPFVALLAPALLAAAMPLLFVARNTTSEPFAFALLWGAVLVLADLHRAPRAATGLAAGLLLGAVVCTRVDALLYVALVVPLAALSIGTAPDPGLRRRRIRATGFALVALVPTVGLAFYDLTARTGNYSRDLAEEISLLRTGSVATVVVSVVAAVGWSVAPRLRTIPDALRAPLAGAVAAAIAVVLLFGWLVRPVLGEAVRPDPLPTVRSIQERDGLELGPARTYAEQSLRWMSWYLGIPALVAAIVGYALAAAAAIRRRTTTDAAVVVVTVVGLASGALYWWNPSITPDHPWATRRFVPAVLPALAVMAAYAMARAVDRAGSILTSRHGVDRRRPVQGSLAAITALAVVALVVPPALTTSTTAWQRTQGGYLRPVLEVCEALPDDAAVLVAGAYESATLTQTLRGWCGVPVAAGATALTPETVLDLAQQIDANGYRLHLVTAAVARFDPYLEVAGTVPMSTSAIDNRWTVLPTLDRPPDHYRDPAEVHPIATPFALHVLEVPVA